MHAIFGVLAIPSQISYVTGWLGRLLSHFPVEVFHVSEALHGSFAKLTPVVQRANGSSQPRGEGGGPKGFI